MSHGIETRQARAARLALHRPPRGHRATNKRRWCKGRVGVEHEFGCWEPGYRPTWKSWYPASYLRGERQHIWAHRICEGCGRVEHFHQKVEGPSP